MITPSYTIDGEFVALISAGASGIGKQIAESLLQLGARVHVCDISDTAISSFLNDNPTATASCCDASDDSQVQQAFDDFKTQYKQLDLLINNVGIAGPTAAVEEIEPDEWDNTIAIDLNANFYFTKLAVPLLKANQGGSIINISSNAAFFGFPYRSPYTASKWALIGLTKTWAMELGTENIRVNAICPGSVNGERINAVIDKDAQCRGVSFSEIRDLYQSQSSMRLFVDATDIAGMVIYLASDAGAKISGQAICIDGHTESLSSI